MVKFTVEKEIIMPSQESLQVYEALRGITGDDNVYKIVEADELMQKLPQFQMSKVQLSSIIRELKDADYINVKYFTPDEYCLLTKKRIEPIPVATEGAEADENPEAEAAEEALQQGERMPYDTKQKGVVKQIKSGIVFLAALMGSLLGSGIIAAITVIALRFI